MSLVYPYLYGTNIEGAGLGSVATLTNGSRVVTGLGGAWESALEWGDDISAGGAFGVIQEVVSDTELLLATEWAGPSQVNGPYVVRRGIANADPRNYGRKVAEYLATLRGLPENMRGLYPYPAWEVDTAYPKDAVTTHDNRLWLALRANTGVEPSEAAAADWAEWLEAPPGPQGAPGVDGFDGWSPELAVVVDGARRVLRVVDWEGGEGTKPPTGLYVGAGGLVADIAQAVDVRGAPGQDGTGTGDVVGPDGGVTDGEVVVFNGATGKAIRRSNGGLILLDPLIIRAKTGTNAHLHLRDDADINRVTLYWDRNLGTTRWMLRDNAGAITSHVELTASDLKVNGHTVYHAGNLPGGGGVDELSFSLLALQVADLANQALFLGDSGNRIFDSFDTLTYVDVAGATNLDTSAPGVLKPTSSAPRIAGATPTGLASPAANFNDNNASTTASWVGTDLSGQGNINNRLLARLDLGSVQTITRIQAVGIYQTAGGSPDNYRLVYSTDGSTWTQLGAGQAASLTPVTFDRTGNVQARYVALALVQANWVSATVVISDLNAYGASTAANMTVASTAFTASAAPSSAKVTARIGVIDPVALNADLMMDVSRDGGATWSQVTLVDQFTQPGSIKVVESNEISIAGQPSGLSPKWRARTANGKMIEIHDVAFYWK